MRGAVAAASAATALAFVLVPLALLGIIGIEGLAQDPYVVFLTAADAVFGVAGGQVVALMLIAAVVLGAEMFIISSSRALCQMSQDGPTLQGYGRRNRNGVPVGSIGWDAAITVLLLALFRSDIVSVVAAANVGYLVVFALLRIAYLLVRWRGAPTAGVRLPAIFVPIAALLALFNGALLIVGGAQWGLEVTGVGAFLTLTFLPFYLFRRYRARTSIVATR